MNIVKRRPRARHAEAGQRVEAGKAERRVDWPEVLAGAPIVVPMAAGALLSWGGLYEAARPWFDPTWLAAVVPVAIDGAIFACAAQWVRGAGRRPVHGWRSATHVFVALTVYLNALAAPAHPDGKAALVVGLHVGGPIVWAGLAELLARQAARRHRDEDGTEAERIPLALWATAPLESFRTKRRMWRTSTTSAVVARREADVIELAVNRLTRLLVGDVYAADLKTLRRRLLAGSIRPLDVLDAIESSRVDGRVESTGTSRVAVDCEALVGRCVELALASSRVDSTVEESSEGRVESIEGGVESIEGGVEESSRLAIESGGSSRVDADRVEVDSPRIVVEPVSIEAPPRGVGVGGSHSAGSEPVPPAVLRAADAILQAWSAERLPRDVKAERARKYLKDSTEEGASWPTADKALRYLRASQNGHTNGHTNGHGSN